MFQQRNKGSMAIKELGALAGNRVGREWMFHIKYLKAVFFPQTITPTLITSKNLQNQWALVL